MENSSTGTMTTTNSTIPPSGPGVMGSVAPMLLMLVAFYFLLMRPQQKREAKRKETVNSAKRDDKVLTSSGIIGKIHKVINEKEVSLEISEGVRIRILKTAIAEILEKNSELGKADDEQNAAASSKKTEVKNVKKAVADKENSTKK